MISDTTLERLRRQARLPDAPAAVASLIEPLLLEIAGPGAEPVSLTLDYGPTASPGAAVVVEAAVERATRTLIFAHGRLLTPEGAVLAVASALFRRSLETSKAV
ncbi:MAG: hypothetical protein Q8Q88_04715 [Phenylobacterium sp.]|uniref:hypothetical protein n=1 Tax=Phenylobacterium sp. TaxID=1871053 RepID=UPI002732EBD0|nr:hypothetical protein [Phenylobacterium sp.]MDP3746335.1 hypothetical protein [Phenylobacterium sp.]